MSVAISPARRAMLATLVAVCGGCYSSSAPPRWLPTAVETQGDAFGSWIHVREQKQSAPLVEGELIAIDADTVHILADGRLVSVPRSRLCCAEVTAYRMEIGELQAWTLLGVISTASHGWGLVVTAPLWTLAGTIAASNASYAPRIVSTDPMVLRPFARFPQGIPQGLDRTTLRSKPWVIPGGYELRQ